MKPVVVHVITGLLTGGAELMLARLMQLHESSRFDHRIICLTDEGATADLIRSYGVSVQNLGMARGLPNPIAIRRLSRMIADANPVVVQTWLYHADLVGGLASRLDRVPVAWGIHHSKLDTATASRSLRATVWACARTSSRIPDAIVCCAEASRVAHIAHGYEPRRMVVIPNGFDVSVYRPDLEARRAIRQELGIPENAPVIGIAGRFVALKNHEMFVAAANLIARDHPGARFVLAGEGLDPDNAELRTWIERAGVVDHVHLLGRRSDLHRVLAAWDICALTSRTEAFPLVIGEAMATGIPCVATDVGDTAFLIGDSGRTVPSGATEAFASAVGELLDLPNDEFEAMGELARQRMIDYFDIHTVAAQYDNLWANLAAGEKPCE